MSLYKIISEHEQISVQKKNVHRVVWSKFGLIRPISIHQRGA